jgi:hypothetical protein
MLPLNSTRIARWLPVALCFVGGLVCVACGGSANDTGRALPGANSVGSSGKPSTSGSAGASANGAAGGDPFGNSSMSPAMTGSGGAVIAEMPGGDTCAQGVANATPVTPTIWLIVDGSSSMEMTFAAGMSRWTTLRATLMDPGGVVDSLQAAARIGMVIYSGDSGNLSGTCPNLVTVQPALNNFATLDAMYPRDPLGMGTPTDKAVDYVVTNLPVLNQGDMLDAKADPIYVVLATDGQPNDLCAGFQGGGMVTDPAVEQKVIDVVTRGTQNGMNMFVISMAGADQKLQDHLDQVAMATVSKLPPFVPSTQADLVATFQTIIGGATCQVSLNGMVTMGQECQGDVQLNGQPIACGSDDGWRLTNPRTVQLTGSVCDMFRTSDSMVVANFPCSVFSPD